MLFCFFMSLLSGVLSVFSLYANGVAGNEFHTCVQHNGLLFHPLAPRVVANGYGVRARSIEGQTLLLQRYALFIFNFFFFRSLLRWSHSFVQCRKFTEVLPNPAP